MKRRRPHRGAKVRIRHIASPRTRVVLTVQYRLSTCWYMYAGDNCLITEPTGSGKTYLACALGHQACRDGHRVCYYYSPKLFRELQSAQADGSLMKLLKKLVRAALLVIDDFGVTAVAGKQYRDLLEILDDRGTARAPRSSPASSR